MYLLLFKFNTVVSGKIGSKPGTPGLGGALKPGCWCLGMGIGSLDAFSIQIRIEENFWKQSRKL
jgi:hypothetical protein